MNLPRLSNGQLQAYAWPGGYPIFYLDSWNTLLCPACANESELSYATDMLEAFCDWCLTSDCSTPDVRFRPQACDIHWEGQPVICETCGAEIDSAYGEVEETDASD